MRGDGGDRAAARWCGLALGAVAALVVLLDLLPALLPGTPFDWAARLAFHGLCHQLPERSPSIDGHVLAVCHRCTGIYAGVWLGGVLAALGVRVPAERRAFWAAAVAPIALHVPASWIFPVLDIPALRVVSGLLTGAASGAALALLLSVVLKAVLARAQEAHS